MECIKPKISIITPLYNAQEYIEQTAKTVLSQTFTEFEWIIVNDGSTDNSLEIVEALNDDRIKIITQENAGAASARNNGISQAQADIIAFLDSDDLWHKDMLEKSYEAFASSKYPKKALSISHYMFQGKDIFYFSPSYNFDGYITSIKRFYPHLFTPSALMLNRSIIDDIGAFDTSLYYHEDYEFAIKLLEKYPVITLKERLMYYRYYIESKGTRCLDNFEYKNSYATILENYFEKTDKEYSKEYRQKAYDICYKTEIFLLLSLKNNIKMARKVFEEKIDDKNSFTFSPRGLVVMLSLITGINFVMPARKFIQRCYLVYFKYISKVRVDG